MKKLITLALSISLWLTLGCGAIHRHPTATKVILIGAGAGAGVVTGILIRRANECPSTINGVPYNGTPSGGKCPEYWPPTNRR